MQWTYERNEDGTETFTPADIRWDKFHMVAGVTYNEPDNEIAIVSAPIGDADPIAPVVQALDSAPIWFVLGLAVARAVIIAGNSDPNFTYTV